MLTLPSFDFYRNPEGINAEGNQAKKPPFDVAGEQLSTGTVKIKPPAFNHRMRQLPVNEGSRYPGISKAEGKTAADDE